MKKGSSWTKEKIGIIVLLATVYGIWFNFLDSAAYCPPAQENSPAQGKSPTDPDQDKKCIPVGQILGNNNVYQPWNIIGHCIPAFLLLALFPKKSELFIASILISSTIMDSPLWGVMRLAHGLPLWHIQDGVNFQDTTVDWFGLWEWTIYYYNPVGYYPVWQDEWPDPGLPNAAMIFWSVVLRIASAIVFILWQKRQEEKGIEFSLKRILLLSKYRNRT